MRKLIIAVMLALLALIAAPLATYAAEEHYPETGWQIREIGLGETDWRDSITGEPSVTAYTATLHKFDGTVGTSIETTDLGLSGEVTVTVAFADGANGDAGAVRVFAYNAVGADTLTAAPDASVVVSAPGTVTLPDIGPIGTFGLVYDASNATTGRVTFSDVLVGDTTVRFTAPPEPPPAEEEPATSDKTCDDFADPSELARHLEQYPGDADRLDPDGDGHYCEQDTQEDPVPVPTAVPAGIEPTGGGPGLLTVLWVAAMVAVGALIYRPRPRGRYSLQSWVERQPTRP